MFIIFVRKLENIKSCQNRSDVCYGTLKNIVYADTVTFQVQLQSLQ